MSHSPSPPRGGRFRFLYQFCLRTLLLATAAAAVFCNWYFQPKYHEEELAGKELRLRRQVKRSNPPDDPFAPTDNSEILNHGNWSLLDGGDLTVARGQFHENAATGKWTAWYPTGGKAAEGRMQQGVKVGRWRTWYEDGKLASDVRFSDQPVKLTDLERGPHVADLSGLRLAPHRPVVASRHGPARSWHANGKLKHEGNFASTRQDGVWTFYDEQGCVTETGPFRAGLRHGEWTILTRSVSEGKHTTTETIRNIDGRTESELNAILKRLKPLVSNDKRSERYAALIDLAVLGERGAPLLLERLASGDIHEQTAIVGMVPRMPTGAPLLLPHIRGYCTSSDQDLAHQARLTLFQIDPASREELFEPLLAEALAAPTLGSLLEELTVLYRGYESRRGEVFAAMMALPATSDDSNAGEIGDAAANLGGNVTPYVLAACEHDQTAVRLHGLQVLQVLMPSWSGRASFVTLDEKDRRALLNRLKRDSSPDVRKAAEELDRLPPPQGFGAGFF